MRMLMRLLAAGLVLAWAGTALAQAGSGSLTGRLLDPNGNLVTGLEDILSLKNVATGEVFADKALSKGGFSLKGLPAGVYDLSLPIPCCMYQTFEKKGVAIAAGQTLALDLNLGWGINLGTIGDDPGMLSADLRARSKNTGGPTPRTAQGRPDLTGLWYDIRQAGPPPQPPMKPWAKDIAAKLREMAQRDPGDPQAQGPAAYCLPQSAVITTLPFPYEFIQTPTRIVQLIEFVTPGSRQIYMDGRKHPDPADWNPSWYGHSIGRWDGDTLVIDTVGFNEVTPGFGVHSEKLHVVERLRRTNKATLEIEVWAEDPEAWTGPYTQTLTAGLVTGEELLEWVCPENNKDPLHFGGLGWKGRP